MGGGGLEPARHRERRAGAGRHAGDSTIGVREERFAVDDHELAVEALHRPDAVVAAREHLADGEIAVVVTVHQRGNRARLHDEMRRFGIVVESGASERGDVQRTDETVVDDVAGHRASLIARTIAAIP